MASVALTSVWGGPWEGHEPDKCAAAPCVACSRKKGFGCGRSSGSEAFADPALKQLSLIVPIITMSTIEKESLAEPGLGGAKAGSALAGFHGGMGDAFRNAPDYQFMCRRCSGSPTPETSSTIPWSASRVRTIR